MKLIMTSIFLGAVLSFAAACSSNQEALTSRQAAPNTSTINTNTAANNGAATHAGISSKADDVPALVKTAFPDAQSFTTQHKDLTKDQIAEIENNSSGKITDTDHHSYLAFSSTGGARKQIGAATVVKAAGKDVMVIYESKNGMPYIKEVRAEGVPAPFLAQFAGKGHDDVVTFGEKIKPNGVDAATAKEITSAVGADALAMQTLYGAAHTH